MYKHVFFNLSTEAKKSDTCIDGEAELESRSVDAAAATGSAFEIQPILFVVLGSDSDLLEVFHRINRKFRNTNGLLELPTSTSNKFHETLGKLANGYIS